MLPEHPSSPSSALIPYKAIHHLNTAQHLPHLTSPLRAESAQEPYILGSAALKGRTALCTGIPCSAIFLSENSAKGELCPC